VPLQLNLPRDGRDRLGLLVTVTHAGVSLQNAKEFGSQNNSFPGAAKVDFSSVGSISDSDLLTLHFAVSQATG